jgi:hypothetical protein
MTDVTLNCFLARGTNAERLAFTPTPPTPASGPDPGYFWYETDTGDSYAWDGAAWDKLNVPTDAELAAIAGLTSAADRLPYFTGSGTAALATFTAAGRALVDDADATAQRTTLGLAIGTNVQAFNARLADVAGATYAQGDVLYFNGANLVNLGPGTSGHFLKTQGAGANPTWAAAAGSIADGDYGDVVVGGSGTTMTLDTVTVPKGGTGATTLTNHGVVLGQGASAVAVTSAGTAGQVLTSGGASADPSWGTGPALQLITETVTSGTAADVTFSSIATTWRDLVVVVRGRGTTAAVAVNILLQFNTDTGANYDYEYIHAQNTTLGGAGTVATTSAFIGQLTAASGTANVAGSCRAEILDYRGTTFQKAGTFHSNGKSGTTTSTIIPWLGIFNWRSTSAINAVKVFPSAGAFVDNSVVSLYGRM